MRRAAERRPADGGCRWHGRAPGGAYASSISVKTFIEAYTASSGSETERLFDALAAANAQIARDARRYPELDGMGCTLVAVACTPSRVQWISVGDSPLYLFRNGRLKRLNADHSMAPLLREAVSRGILSESDAASHPDRQVLQSALTGDEPELIDLPEAPLELEPGDRLLLGTDGILTLSETAIAALMANNSHRSAVEVSAILLEAIGAAGQPDQDNATVLVVAPDAAPPEAETVMPAGRTLLSSTARPGNGRGGEPAGRSPLHPLVMLLLGAIALGAAALLAAVAAHRIGYVPLRWEMQRSTDGGSVPASGASGGAGQPEAAHPAGAERKDDASPSAAGGSDPDAGSR